MKYTVDFDNNTVTERFLDIYNSFERSKGSFETKDLMRTICNTISFEAKVGNLKLFGADVETGSYMDGEYLLIGYARINNHEFVKNGKINYKELKDGLWEIAHPEK